MRKQTDYWAVILAASVVGLTAVTAQSLWIDEGSAALKAMQPTLGGWWDALRAEGNSNLQLIFQLGYLWCWEKVFGASEWSLRASNIPWFVVGAVFLFSATFERRYRLTLVALTLSSSFLWYYLSEARPYIVLFAFSSITVASLLRLAADSLKNETTWFRWLCIGTVGLTITSMVAVPWALGALAAIWYWTGPKKIADWIRRCPIATVLTILAYLLSGLYYLWTIKIGARASSVGHTSILNLALIFYELSGLSGLGPGRLDLRETGIPSFMPYVLPLIGASAIVAIVYAMGARALCKKLTWRGAFFVFLAAGGPFLLVFSAALAQGMRLLARHVTPLLPFVLFIAAYGLTEFLYSLRRSKRLIGLVFIVVCICSTFQIRFAARHQRDDYRDATLSARDRIERGQAIWWVADVQTASYYALPLDSPKLLVTPRASSLDTLPLPDAIYLSKPDIYDANGRITDYLHGHHYELKQTFPAFKIWEKPHLQAD